MAASLITEPWQDFLNRNQEKFASIKRGARMGFLPNVNGARLAKIEGEVMVWRMQENGFQVELQPFTGFQKTGLDILLVLEEEAFRRMSDGLAGDPFPDLARDALQGRVLNFYLKSRDDLMTMGYEDFFAQVGLSFAGACR